MAKYVLTAALAGAALVSLHTGDMLPSRLFRNLGIPPPLRSLLVLHPALSSAVAVQLRFRLRLSPLQPSQPIPSSSRHLHSTSRNEVSSSRTSLDAGSQTPSTLPAHSNHERPIAEEVSEPRLSLTFTCTVPDCSERSTHEFTKRAYQRGIVLVTCPKCKNRCASQATTNPSRGSF